MEFLIISGVPLSALIFVIVESLKRAELIAPRYLPLCAVALGAIFALVAAILNGAVGIEWLEYFVVGAMAGASAVGIHESGKGMTRNDGS